MHRFKYSVLEYEIPPINNTGVWPTGWFISSFYDKLTPDHLYSSSTPIKLIENWAPSVAASRSISSNTLSFRCQWGPWAKRLRFLIRHDGLRFSCKFGSSYHVWKDYYRLHWLFYQNVLGLRTKYSNVYEVFMFRITKLICITEMWQNDSF
jgi:hypothetical protein